MHFCLFCSIFAKKLLNMKYPQKRFWIHKAIIKKTSLFLALCSLFLLFGCNRNVIFSEYHNISNDGWNKDSVFSFEFEITDTISNYIIDILMRNTDDFPRQNLWLGIELLKDNKVILTDTVEFFLSNDYGEWRGKGVGSYFDNEFEYKKNESFYKSGKYICNLRHIMRFEKLAGLKYIGLRIEKKK